ncbi:uncharacterized protein OCT59_019120 [Rhizophagus irregularis]|uniref:F-box domain-containing protein n=3 Tax=Rhizophagus irregularis TaxID=588596 RepID=A0A015J5D9_RHIIW|nr:hypothetical protein GLOIN_2v1790166 [Rhizophagus irregularis DAOM 181602=DAOM 197198]EXX64737.1 hypothetical protein RirG_139970 [Rhizophagus irregularis DAOM 197198w]POG58619.1 hypothetical protein GLOIN_2v1790166 [Rhizophagus irregularis DAOM 181602=DAOM 197198]UZO26908.1 hypothetical protein OCT59_019120 [Rhizophagus irregularis]|eukprot:XP_025165485.1 hypothetical protein GLOIN_2v1790166 [Rhizophagus irregularis DAOM 181602=DAOM 197198]
MSISKIFSGDLPELLYKIINYFQGDYSTLHSCVLVNRLWCRLTIPLLWEDPFSIPTGNFNFIEVYLYYLNDHLKTKLNEHEIINNVLLPSNTLFNYPSFIRYLNINKIVPSIESWLGANDKIKLTNAYYEQISDTETEFKCWINILIFKMFIKHEVKLHTLEIEISRAIYNKHAENILEIILQNPNFIHNVRNLKLSILSSINNTLIKNRISQLINLQKNLKKVSFSSNTLPLYQSLLLSRESNCSNTLNTIIFYYVNFKGINNLDKVFEQLNVLESVHLIHCSFLNTGFIQQIINLTKPFKLKTLFVSKISQIESLQSLLQKSGNYLENFGCGLEGTNYNQRQQLLELIIKCCKNIKFLDLDNVITPLMISLIENVKQNLNRLSISVGNNQDSNSKLVLQNLGQILPSRLDYLCMSLYDIKESDFEVFIKNSQDTYFKKLLIEIIERDDISDGTDILPYIKEYIMKKKRVNYLAIKYTYPSSWFDEMDLSDSGRAEEFKLYNIKVLSYISLFIDINRFVNELIN